MQFICNDLRKFETAKELNKCQSTISKEIKNKRKKVKKQGKNFCLVFYLYYSSNNQSITFL